MRIDPKFLLLLAAFLVAACGGEESRDVVSAPTTREATVTPTATPTAVTTPSPTATPSPAPVPPEQQEGGAGDEAGIGQGAGFAIGRDGDIFPPEIEVTAFLPVRLSLANEGGADVSVDLSSLGKGTVTVPGGGSTEVRLAGPRPGRYDIRAGGRVAVLAAIAGGPE